MSERERNGKSKRDRALYWIGRMDPRELRDFCHEFGLTLDQIADALTAGAKWDLMLADDAGKKINAIKIVREHTRLGLKEAKDAVDRAPASPVLTDADRDLLQRVADDMAKMGMLAHVRRAA